MTKPVTGLTVFGSNTTGTTTELDNNFSDLQDGLNDLNTYSNYLVDSGSANAYSVTLGANLTGALTAGLKIQMKAANTNTAASTLNYNGTGIVAIQTTGGAALGAGQIQANGIYDLIYTGSVWQLQTAASGGMTVVANRTSNGNTTIDFNATLSTAFPAYKLVGSNITVTGNQSSLLLRFGNGNANAGAYAAANYIWSSSSRFPDGATTSQGSTANAVTSGFSLSFAGASVAGLGSAANQPIGFSVTIYAPGANSRCQSDWSTNYINAANSFTGISGGGAFDLVTEITSVRILPSNGNMRSGDFTLYGLLSAP